MGSFGVVLARTVPQLMLFRVLQAFGGGGGMSGAPSLPGGLGSARESTLRPFHLLGCTCG